MKEKNANSVSNTFLCNIFKSLYIMDNFSLLFYARKNFTGQNMIKSVIIIPYSTLKT